MNLSDKEDAITDWSEFGWEVIKSTDIDRRAHRHFIGRCVACGKGEQEVAGNVWMAGIKTHCYICYLAEEKIRAKEKKK